MSEDFLKRVPPHSADAEMAVLGGVLLDNKAMGLALAILETEDFYREPHRLLYAAMVSLSDRSIPIDIMTLTDALGGKEILERIGGASYLAEIVAFVPSASHTRHYAEIVRRKAVMRRLQTVAGEIVADTYEPGKEADMVKFLTESEAKIAAACRMQLGAPRPPLDDRVTEVMGRVNEPVGVRRVSTAFEGIDTMLQGGMRRGDLVVLAARPSIGKTALALNMCTHLSRGGALFLSVEMRDDQLIERALSDLGGVSWREIEMRKEVWDSEVERLAFAGATLGTMNLEILKKRALTPRELRREAILASHKWDGKLDLVVADYLQLMKPDEKQDSKNYDIAEITGALKDLAEEMDCAVLLLSQLGRDVNKRVGSGMPMLEDLRDSGAIEQDADVVIFLWRRQPGKGEEENPDRPVNLTIAKHRNGPLGTLELDFDRQHTRFRTR